MIIYIPFFSWIPRLFPSRSASTPTDPNTPNPPTKMEILARWIQAFNMLWLTFCTAISALFYVIVLIDALVYVDERRTRFFQLPKNTRQIWKSRALMVTFIALSIGLGYGAFSVLEMTELAKVKTFEYVAIVVPVQINIGMSLATVAQRKMEKTAAMKAARREQHVEEQGSLAAEVIDEKMPLMAGK
jgi:prepilin signal peptidase PulO-like enzyme (type II secretory pathway)